MTFLIISIPILIVYLAGLWKMFEKAGQPGWQALIPIYRNVVWLRIINKPIYWTVLLFVPIVNVFIAISMLIELVKRFNKVSFFDHAMTILFWFIFIPKIGFSKDEKFIGENYLQIKKSTTREWVDALLFAVLAATLIRMFIFEAYTIPTPSMEKTLLVGDFLFVSKIHYGPRIPNTPLSFPFAHNTMPLIGGKSYLTWIQWPYYRLPALQKIKNNDIVVFNWPNDPAHPVDKKTNYIKRCVGIPGDTIQIVAGHVQINGKPIDLFPQQEFEYFVKTDGTPLSNKNLEQLGIHKQIDERTYENGAVTYLLTLEQAEEFRKLKFITSVEEVIWPAETQRGPPLFPNDNSPHLKEYRWNIDYYGPVWIPEKGTTITLTSDNYKTYETVITRYEHHTFEFTPQGKFKVDGKETDSYTFQYDYYWMQGDNRHNSEDSRFWGFVPETHVVGKAWFIWMSWSKYDKGIFNKIRWNRLFNSIH